MTASLITGPRDMHQVRLSMLENYASPTVSLIDDTASGSAEALIPALDDGATLFYVSADMCEFAFSAAETLESWTVDPSDIPARCGLVWFEQAVAPFGDTPMHLLAFTTDDAGVYLHAMVPLSTIGGMAGTFRAMLADADDTEWAKDNGDERRRYAERFVGAWDAWEDHGTRPPYFPIIARHNAFGEPFLRSDEFDDPIGPRVMSTFLLMQQTLAATSEAHPPRPVARRAARASRRLDPVRVVALRRPAGAPSPETAAGREWRHQWVVRGHWRRQPVGPGRSQRRPVWIAPHVKGPEGAPLLGGEKVYAWVR